MTAIRVKRLHGWLGASATSSCAVRGWYAEINLIYLIFRCSGLRFEIQSFISRMRPQQQCDKHHEDSVFPRIDEAPIPNIYLRCAWDLWSMIEEHEVVNWRREDDPRYGLATSNPK